jgi:HAE1 family hydrophobic/amphiphilic exporter-1
MTSFAFIVGCIPLALASGSGAVARQVLGTGVIGGMVAASLLAIFLIPAGFCVVETLAALVERKNRGQLPPPPDL